MGATARHFLPDTPLPTVRLGLSRVELAVAIGVSPTSIDQMVEEGVLPRPRKWHKRKIWLIAEVQQAMFGWPAEGEETGEDADDSDWRASA